MGRHQQLVLRAALRLHMVPSRYTLALYTIYARIAAVQLDALRKLGSVC
jgi:hypothetical protein